MENLATFALEGITLQHAGELLFETPITIKERTKCPQTYLRSLEDFCFAYLYGSFSHTGKLPTIDIYEPGKMLIDRFSENFVKLDDNNHAKVKAFLKDQEIVYQLSIDMKNGFYAYQVNPKFWEEWITRESKAYLGSDSSLYEDLPQTRLYKYAKKPAYLKSKLLQDLIPKEFFQNLIPIVKKTIKDNKIKEKAIKEFISRCFLTHQTIYWWYNHLIEQNNPNFIQVPHITRSLVRSVIYENRNIEYIRLIKNILVRPALYEATKPVIKNRSDLIDSLKMLRVDKSFENMRDRLKTISNEIDNKNATKRIEKLLTDIRKISKTDILENVDLTFKYKYSKGEIVLKTDLNPLRLLVPQRLAFRKIIKSYDEKKYFQKLKLIFPELFL
jgi:hypothetical protein